jgi:hypothetical protein
MPRRNEGRLKKPESVPRWKVFDGLKTRARKVGIREKKKMKPMGKFGEKKLVTLC